MTEIWESCDGLCFAEIATTNPDPPWPAFVVVDCESFSVLSDDARELARLLIQAADEADGKMALMTLSDEQRAKWNLRGERGARWICDRLRRWFGIRRCP